MTERLFFCGPPKPMPRHNRNPPPPTIYYRAGQAVPIVEFKPTKRNRAFRSEMRDKRKAKYARLRLAQGGCCYLCGFAFSATDLATEDHVMPRSKGGKRAGNILLAHSSCNNAKGNREPLPHELRYLAKINAMIEPGMWAQEKGPG